MSNCEMKNEKPGRGGERIGQHVAEGSVALALADAILLREDLHSEWRCQTWSEVRSQRSEVRGQKSEVRSRKLPTNLHLLVC
jgi:hypothetical protein